MAHNLFNSLQEFNVGPKRGKFYNLAALEAAESAKFPGCRFRFASCWNRCCAIATASRSPRSTCVSLPAGSRPPPGPTRFRSSWRVVLQDFTGVPLLADLAAMRNVADAMGKNAKTIEPLVPVDLVVDHSVMVDHYGTKDALDLNMKLEFQRNRERYEFMKWGMQAFDISASCRRASASCIKSISNIWRAVFTRDGIYFPTRWSAPTVTRR